VTYEPRAALRIKVMQKLLAADSGLTADQVGVLADSVMKLFREVRDEIDSLEVAVDTPARRSTRTVWQRHMEIATWYEQIEWRPVGGSE
jgi:hypothetical protein